MSFLDNLENNLKSLESQEEASETRRREQDRREGERARVLAAAPWAEKLKSSEYTAKLLKQATAEGYKVRTKVYIAWNGAVLRLEAKGRRLELRPGADGITAVFLEGGAELSKQMVDLTADPGELARQLLALPADHVPGE